jgi:hypothetical protein
LTVSTLLTLLGSGVEDGSELRSVAVDAHSLIQPAPPRERVDILPGMQATNPTLWHRMTQHTSAWAAAQAADATSVHTAMPYGATAATLLRLTFRLNRRPKHPGSSSSSGSGVGAGTCTGGRAGQSRKFRVKSWQQWRVTARSSRVKEIAHSLGMVLAVYWMAFTADVRLGRITCNAFYATVG